MRIFRLTDPKDHSYARASRIGTWAPENATECPQCGNPRQQRVQPLVIEWEPGSAVVGDFTWPGFDDEVLVSAPVLEALDGVSGFEAGPVIMHQDPKLCAGKGKPRVWLPYEGIPLSDFWVTTWVSMDHERSTARCTENCDECGLAIYELEGNEKREFAYDAGKRELVTHHSVRLPGAGIFVFETSLQGANVFRVKEFPSWVFITERAKLMIERQGPTNVGFLEMGDAV